MDTNQEKIDAGLQEMKAQVASLTSWFDVNQEEMTVRVSAILYKMEATIKCCHETLGGAEDILACVDQRMHGLCKKLNEKIDEVQVDLQAVKMSLDNADEGPPRNPSRHEEGPSQRAGPHVPQDSWIVLLKSIGSLGPFIFLFLVKGIITILFGLIDKFVLLRHCWAVHRAVCNTSDRAGRNFALIRIAMPSAYLTV
jgi:hypothetical protein